MNWLQSIFKIVLCFTWREEKKINWLYQQLMFRMNSKRLMVDWKIKSDKCRFKQFYVCWLISFHKLSHNCAFIMVSIGVSGLDSALKTTQFHSRSNVMHCMRWDNSHQHLLLCGYSQWKKKKQCKKTKTWWYIKSVGCATKERTGKQTSLLYYSSAAWFWYTRRESTTRLLLWCCAQCIRFAHSHVNVRERTFFRINRYVTECIALSTQHPYMPIILYAIMQRQWVRCNFSVVHIELCLVHVIYSHPLWRRHYKQAWQRF